MIIKFLLNAADKLNCQLMPPFLTNLPQTNCSTYTATTWCVMPKRMRELLLLKRRKHGSIKESN